MHVCVCVYIYISLQWDNGSDTLDGGNHFLKEAHDDFLLTWRVAFYCECDIFKNMMCKITLRTNKTLKEDPAESHSFFP